MQIAFIITSILLMIVLLIGSGSSSTGLISYIIKYIGLGLAIIAFLNPKFGAYILLFEAFFVDYIKRFAVFYGAVSTNSIIEVLIVQMLAVIALIVAVFIGIFKGSVKFNRGVFLFFILGLLCAAIKLYTGDDDLTSNIKEAFNLGAYISITFVFFHLFKDYGLKLRTFFNVMLGITVFSSLLAIRQSFFGFTEVEDYYMHTFLSPVASVQYLTDLQRGLDPRGFGLASGVMNFICVCGLASYAFFSINRRKKFSINFIYLLAYLLIGFALYAVRLKTGMVLILLCPLVAIILKQVKFIYFSGLAVVVVFTTIVLNSGYLLDSLVEIDHAVRSSFGLADAYSIQTFEARLYSYEQMLEPKNWTPFGVNTFFETHDLITFCLLEFGYIFLFLCFSLSIVIFILFVERIKSLAPNLRSQYLCFCGSFGLLFIANIVGGSNIGANPVNLVLWTSLAGAIYCGWGQSQNTTFVTNKIDKKLKVENS